MGRTCTLPVAVLVAALVSGGAAAFDCQLDVNYGVTSGGLLPEDITALGLGVDYYFSGVTDSRYPHDLQPFFQKAPYAEVVYAQVDNPLEVKAVDVNAELFMADPVGGLSFRPHIIHGTVDLGAPFGLVTTNTWQLDIGYYVLDELKVTLPGLIAGYLDEDQGDLVDEDVSFKDVRVEYVVPVSGQHVAVQVDYGWDVDGDMTDLDIGAMYYPTKVLGAGLTLNNNPDGLTSIFIGASYWLAPTVGIALEYGIYTEDAGVLLEDANTVNFALSARF